MTQRILPIYVRYLASGTLEEQKEIINKFFKVIDMNDNKKTVKTNIEKCRTSKINLSNSYLFKTFLTDVAKHICQYGFTNGVDAKRSEHF